MISSALIHYILDNSDFLLLKENKSLLFSECIFIKFGTVSCLISRQCSHFFHFQANAEEYWKILK